MLYDKAYIVEDDHYAEYEFDYIDFDVLSEDCFECHLCKGEDSSGEIEDDIGNRPPLGGFPLIVPVELGEVLQEGDGEFEVAHQTDYPHICAHRNAFSSLNQSSSTSVSIAYTITKVHNSNR